MICGSGGSKSRLAKAAGAGPSGQIRDEKVHAVVARSALQSQNVQSTTGSEHFWKSGSRKSARRCGAKKHFNVGALLEVEISKKCMPLCGALLVDVAASFSVAFRASDLQVCSNNFAQQLQHFVCTSYDVASLFRGIL